MKKVLAAALLTTFTACSDPAAPSGSVQLGPSATLAEALAAPAYSDAYDHAASRSGQTRVRRVTQLDVWFPAGRATLTIYPIEPAPPNPQTGDAWRGVPGQQPIVVLMTLEETDLLFSSVGVLFAGPNVFRVDVPVRNRNTGEIAHGYDWFRVTG
jgi:hypothetical protein